MELEVTCMGSMDGERCMWVFKHTNVFVSVILYR